MINPQKINNSLKYASHIKNINEFEKKPIYKCLDEVKKYLINLRSFYHMEIQKNFDEIMEFNDIKGNNFLQDKSSDLFNIFLKINEIIKYKPLSEEFYHDIECNSDKLKNFLQSKWDALSQKFEQSYAIKNQAECSWNLKITNRFIKIDDFMEGLKFKELFLTNQKRFYQNSTDVK